MVDWVENCVVVSEDVKILARGLEFYCQVAPVRLPLYKLFEWKCRICATTLPLSKTSDKNKSKDFPRNQLCVSTIRPVTIVHSTERGTAFGRTFAIVESRFVIIVENFWPTNTDAITKIIKQRPTHRHSQNIHPDTPPPWANTVHSDDNDETVLF